MRLNVMVLPGDGIGPEVCAAAVAVLERTAELFGHELHQTSGDIGGIAIDNHGNALPEATQQGCLAADAVLLGAVGGPKWSDPKAAVRPEQGLLALRKLLNVYANLRPVVPHPATLNASPIKAERLQNVDLMIVRELTGGIYFGKKNRTETSASDECVYTVEEIERVTRTSFALARLRRKKLTSVDKANVLETSRLWREVVIRIHREEFSDVALEHQLVDAFAMHVLNRPADFDVVLTENMFGDILSDETSMLAGSLGLLPSASIGEGTRGLYEPIHGSAPDIAGKGIANPYGAILSTAMMLRLSFKLETEAQAIEQAVSESVLAGALTPDIAQGKPVKSTQEVTQEVLKQLVLIAQKQAA